MSATALIRTSQKTPSSLFSLVSAFADDPVHSTAHMLGAVLATNSGGVAAGTRVVNGMFSLKDRVSLPDDREEALHDMIAKCQEMRKQELGGAQEVIVPRLVPPSPAPRLLPPLAIPTTPAKGDVEPESPRPSLATQRESTDAQFRTFVRRTECFSAAFLMLGNPSTPPGIRQTDQRHEDLEHLKQAVQETERGQKTLWQACMTHFGNRLTWGGYLRAGFYYWAGYKTGIIQTIVHVVGTNVLNKFRVEWIHNKSKTSVFELLGRVLPNMPFPPTAVPDDSLNEACKKASSVFLDSKNGYLNGLRWLNRQIVESFLPSVLQNVMHLTLGKTDKSHLPFLLACTKFADIQATAFAKKLSSPAHRAMPLPPEQIPDLPGHLGRLFAALGIRETIGNTIKDETSAAATAGFHHLLRDNQPLEFSLTFALELINSSMQPAPQLSTDQAVNAFAALETDKTKAKRQLDSHVRTIFDRLLAQMDDEPMDEVGAAALLKIACETQTEAMTKGLAEIERQIKSWDLKSIHEPRFKEPAHPSHEFLNHLSRFRTHLHTFGEILVEKASQLKDELPTKRLKDGFDLVFVPLYYSINQLRSITQNLREEETRAIHSAQLMALFQRIDEKIAILKAPRGEITQDVADLLQAVQQIKRCLPPTAPELSTLQELIDLLQLPNGDHLSLQLTEFLKQQKISSLIDTHFEAMEGHFNAFVGDDKTANKNTSQQAIAQHLSTVVTSPNLSGDEKTLLTTWFPTFFSNPEPVFRKLLALDELSRFCKTKSEAYGKYLFKHHEKEYELVENLMKLNEFIHSSLQKTQPALPAPLKVEDLQQTIAAPAIGFSYTQAMNAYNQAFSLFTSQGFYRSLTLALLTEFNRH